MSTEYLDQIKDLYYQQDPFVIYRNPLESHLNLVVQKSKKLFNLNHYEESGFVIAPFKEGSPPFILRPDQQKKIIFEAGNSKTELFANEEIEARTNQNIYENLVNRALLEIRSARIQKVVLSRKISFSYHDLPFHSFHRLLAEHSKAFCYLWHHPEIGIWSGATPELFLQLEDQLLTTYSLAGTKTIEEGIEANWRVKETEEQAFVTRYIEDQLLRYCSEVNISPAVTIKAGNLWHLKSEITAKLSNTELGPIIKALHPTPAVCGTPKDEAYRFILEHEGYDRKFYTGYLGELNLENKGNCRLFVNLRCMEWVDQMAHIYVGGGITDRSVPEEEWAETEYKSLTMLSTLFNYQK